MGVIVFDNEDQNRHLVVNWWNWRATLSLIERMMPEVDRDELEKMSFSGGAGTLTKEQARTLAARLRSTVLKGVPQGGRVLLDGSVTTEPDDLKFHKGDDVELNYSATQEWLEQFVQFCETCNGFRVS